MFQLKLKDYILIALLAFLLGIASPHLIEWFTGKPKEETAAAPADISTNPFTLHLLRAGIQTQPQGNVVLLPNTVATLLAHMKECASPDVAAEIDKLCLPESPLWSSARLGEYATLFADSSAKLSEETAALYTTRVPFAEQPATAIKNISFSTAQNTNWLINPEITGDDVSSNTTLLALGGFHCAAEWQQDIRPADTRGADFENADGGIPKVYMMQAYAQRYARHPQGEWEAAAVCLVDNPFYNAYNSLPPCELIIICPNDRKDVRHFAAALTPESFNSIRTALRDSSTPCSLYFPRLHFRSTNHSILPLLDAMGLQKLTHSRAPFSKLAPQGDFPLSATLQKYNISFAESTNSNSKPAPATDTELRADHPFLWFLMPLDSPHAPYAMGIVEKL